MWQEHVLPWLGVGLAGTVLTFIALGHTGPSDTGGKCYLLPFGEYGPMILCLVKSCRSASSAARFLVINGLGNVIVFMPWGGMLYLALRPLCQPTRSILWATLAGGVLSLVYEIVQLWIPGRVVATDDLILNTLGSALGAGLAWLALVLWGRLCDKVPPEQSRARPSSSSKG